MRTRGFTLIEVMLSVVIFSIVLVAIHTVFYSAVFLRNKTTEAIEQQIPIQQALTLIERDLANVVLPGSNFFGELQTAQANNTSTNLLSSLNPVNDAIPGQSGPPLFTASGVSDETVPWNSIQRVVYYLAAPTNNLPGKVLIRSVTRNLLPVNAEQPDNQPLLNGLQSLAFYYYDGTQWRDYWDSTTETNKLPYGFKVQLQFVREAGDRTARLPVELVVPVILQVGTNETSQSTSGGGA